MPGPVRVEPGPAGDRIPAIDGLRALAIVLVFVAHFLAPFGSSLGLGSDAGRFLRALAQVGFDVFFFVTGFVCHRALMARPRPASRWLAQRIERVYPLFVPVLLAWVLLALAFPDKSKVPGSQPEATLYLLQNFLLLPGPFPIEPLMGAAWALGYGMVFCVVLPVFVAVFRRTRAPFAVRAAVIVIAALACIAGFTWTGGPVRLAVFASGMLVHEIVARRVATGGARPVASGHTSHGMVTAVVGAVGVALLVAALFLPALPLPRMPAQLLEGIKVLVLTAAFVGIGVATLRAPSVGDEARASRGIRWLAALAYPMFLVHGLVLQVGTRVFDAAVPPAWAQPAAWLALPVLFAGALLLAWLMAGLEARVVGNPESRPAVGV